MDGSFRESPVSVGGTFPSINIHHGKPGPPFTTNALLAEVYEGCVFVFLTAALTHRQSKVIKPPVS